MMTIGRIGGENLTTEMLNNYYKRVHVNGYYSIDCVGKNGREMDEGCVTD